VSKRLKIFLLICFVLGLLGFIFLKGIVFLGQSGKATPFEVKGLNMEPNYRDGQFWLIDEKVYKSNPPQRGDAVVYKIGEGSEEKWRMQRIVGLPGETISIKEGDVYINGELLNEDSYKGVDVMTYAGAFLAESQEYSISDGSYFMMGDNRSYSLDSREIGPIPLNEFVGKVTICYNRCN